MVNRSSCDFFMAFKSFGLDRIQCLGETEENSLEVGKIPGARGNPYDFRGFLRIDI